MGTCATSNLGDFNYEEITKNYAHSYNYNDPRFGEVRVLKHKRTGATILQKDQITNTARSAENYLRRIQTRSEHPHSNIIKIIGYTSRRDDSFCSTHYRTSVFFESFATDLEVELQRRIKNQERFSEEDLWNILKSVASAGASLQLYNEFHGDIRPHNILITLAREYKISDDLSFAKAKLALYFAHLGGLEDHGRLYSPLVFANLNKYYEDERGRVSINVFKSEVFSLGMTLLECASLERADKYYDIRTHRIRFNLIQRQLEDLKRYYSASFVEVLGSTLEELENNRLEFSEIGQAERGSYKGENRNKKRQPKAVAAGNPDAEEGNEEIQTYRYFGDEELENKVREAVAKTNQAMSRISAKRAKRVDNPLHKQFFDTYNSQLSDSSTNRFTQPILQPSPKYDHSAYVSSSPVLSKYGPYLSNYKPEYNIGPAKSNSAVDYVRNKYGSAFSSYRPLESPYYTPQYESGKKFNFDTAGGSQNTAITMRPERSYQTPERPH